MCISTYCIVIMEMLDSVFGSCFRSVVWGTNNNERNKYIDYIPSKKWKYKDENLMHELSDRQTWDVADLTEDELYEERIPNSIKVRLHDNVFLNPLNESSTTTNNNSVPDKQKTDSECMKNDPTSERLKDLANNQSNTTQSEETVDINSTSSNKSPSRIVDVTPHEVKSPSVDTVEPKK